MKLPFLSLTLAANSAVLANAADGGSPFAILQGDGFVIPYGEFPHKLGLQKFDRAAAEEMVAAHNSMLNSLLRQFGGGTYPVYVGHPDLPGSKDADKRAYGWIESLRAENDGLHLSVKWSDAGRELIENAHFKFYSPLWWTRKVKGGIRPVGLKSMGLTNDPNIPVPALANEADGDDDDSSNQNTDHDMNGILAALGLNEGATPEEVMARITALLEAENALAAKAGETTAAETAKAEAEAAKQEAENSLATANTRIAALEGEVAAANDARAAALDLLAGNAVDAAVAAGRITPAEAAEKRAELLAANDLTEAIAALAALPPKFKTASTTGDLGEAKARLAVAQNDAAAAAREERARLVENEYQAITAKNPDLSLGARKRIAWQRAQAKHPEAFTKDSSGTAA